MSDLHDPQAKAAIRGWIEQQFEEMERASYYQLLDVQHDAPEMLIRKRYYELVARFHPDLYVNTLDGDVRQKLVTMYSRIVEAYQCLISGEKRSQYDRLLAKGKLRWTAEEERVVVAASKPDSEIKNPQAKKLYQLGKQQLLAGNPKGAVMNLKMALSAEPDNTAIKAELAKAEAALKGG